MIKLWDQDLQGYQFSVTHRSNKMMKYVDAINRFYEPEIATHLKVAGIIRKEKNTSILETCDHTIFHTLNSPQHIGKG